MPSAASPPSPQPSQGGFWTAVGRVYGFHSAYPDIAGKVAKVGAQQMTGPDGYYVQTFSTADHRKRRILTVQTVITVAAVAALFFVSPIAAAVVLGVGLLLLLASYKSAAQAKRVFVERESQLIAQNSQSGQNVKSVLFILPEPETDHNGAFFDVATLVYLQKLAEKNSVKVLQVDSNCSSLQDLQVKGFYDRIELCGHGCPSDILLSRKFSLMSSDTASFQWLSSHLRKFPKSAIFLRSCSTGEGDDNIAKEISKACGPDVEVHAPIFNAVMGYKSEVSEVAPYYSSEHFTIQGVSLIECYYRDGEKSLNPSLSFLFDILHQQKLVNQPLCPSYYSDASKALHLFYACLVLEQDGFLKEENSSKGKLLDVLVDNPGLAQDFTKFYGKMCLEGLRLVDLSDKSHLHEELSQFIIANPKVSLSKIADRFIERHRRGLFSHSEFRRKSLNELLGLKQSA